MRQTCSCRCGASRFAVNGEPIGRFYCHCTICQAVYQQPYADVTIFPARAVALPDNSAVTFRHYRPPPALSRGTCPACAAPVVAFMALGPLKMFAFVRSQNLERPSELPEPSSTSSPGPNTLWPILVVRESDCTRCCSHFWPTTSRGCGENSALATSGGDQSRFAIDRNVALSAHCRVVVDRAVAEGRRLQMIAILPREFGRQSALSGHRQGDRQGSGPQISRRVRVSATGSRASPKAPALCSTRLPRAASSGRQWRRHASPNARKCSAFEAAHGSSGTAF